MYILKIRILAKQHRMARSGSGAFFSYKALASSPFFNSDGSVEPGHRLIYASSNLDLIANDQKYVLVHVSVNDKDQIWISGIAS